MSIGSAFQWPQYPTAAAADAPRQQRRGRGRLDRQQRRQRPLLGRRSRRRREGHRRRVVRQHATSALPHVHRLSRRPPDRLQPGHRRAAAADSGSLPDGAHRHGRPRAADACDGDRRSAGSLTGKVVLIRRGTCGFYEKALNAQNARRGGVVLYNNVAGALNPTVAAGTPRRHHDSGGRDLRHRGRADRQPPRRRPGDMTWTDQTCQRSRTPTGGLISSLQLVRPARRPDAQAGHRRAGRVHPLDLSDRAGRLRHDQRHLDGLAARGGGGGAAAAGAPEHVPQARSATSSRTAPTRRPGGAIPASASWTTSTVRAPACSTSTTRSCATDARSSPASCRSARASRAGHAHADHHQQRRRDASPTTCRTSAALATGPNTFTPSFFDAAATVASASPSGRRCRPAAQATVDVTITRRTGGSPTSSLYGGYVVLHAAGRRPGSARAVRRLQGRLPVDPGAAADGPVTRLPVPAANSCGCRTT